MNRRTLAVLALLWAALLAPPVRAQTTQPSRIFLAPIATTDQDLAGTGISIMPTVYMGGETVLHPYRPHVHDVDTFEDPATGKARRSMVYDGPSAAAVASDLRKRGITHAVYDWEPGEYGDLNLRTLGYALKVQKVFASRGVKLDFWGAGDKGATDPISLKLTRSCRWSHPIYYSFGRNPTLDEWIRARITDTLVIRKQYRQDLAGWINVYDLDGTPIPADRFRGMLRFVLDHCDYAVVWVRCAKDGRVSAFDGGEWWPVMKAMAAEGPVRN